MSRTPIRPDPDRRRLLAGLAWAGAAAACASRGEPRLAKLLPLLRGVDLLLLGEQHDNPHHHRQRAALVVQLGPAAAVVAEQLPRGAHVAAGADPRSRLEAAGFDSQAWGWPLYRELFVPLLDAGLPLHGGNVPRELVRQVAREGPSAWPADLRPLLDAAPLSTAAQDALDRSLLDGHCGQLPAARLPAMRAAQRLRDASMALALLQRHAAGARPAVLLAGNGHVRRDHGVVPLLRTARPALRLLSVGFAEPDWPTADAAYDHLWITPAVPRADPCAGFRLPASRT